MSRLEEACRKAYDMGATHGAQFERARILYVLETALARGFDAVAAVRGVLTEVKPMKATEPEVK